MYRESSRARNTPLWSSGAERSGGRFVAVMASSGRVGPPDSPFGVFSLVGGGGRAQTAGSSETGT